MSRRWGVWALGFTFLVVAGCLSLAQPLSSISPANAERIKPGMTEKEVEGILGRKADVPYVGMAGVWPPGSIRAALWEGLTGDLMVYFILDPIECGTIATGCRNP